MATFAEIPPELLRIIAADPDLTNRDRKQARLASANLAGAMTPFVFKRAYLSRIKNDYDAFLSLAATPHLAAHVEEVVWFELGCDLRAFENLPDGLKGFEGLREHLLSATRDLCWLPLELPLKRDDWGAIVHRSPPECSTSFLAQFKAAVAHMPKLHSFAWELMPWQRILSTIPDGYPFDVGLMRTHAPRDMSEYCSGFLQSFLNTITEEQGRITRLRCVNEMSCSLGPVVTPGSHSYAAFQNLTSFDLSVTDLWSAFAPLHHYEFEPMLQGALFQASKLQELSISLQCGAETMRTPKPFPALKGLFFEPSGKVHVWQHLRSLKLGNLDMARLSLLPVIEAHVTTLRHLHLEQCRPAQSFALELSQLSGLQLDSITVSDSEIPKSGLISEDELMRFIRQGDTEDKRQARKIAKGKFVTDNRRTDNIGDDLFEDFDSDHCSDHSSEWWSDIDSEPELDTVSASWSCV